MASFLHRSKSTREIRTLAGLPERTHNFSFSSYDLRPPAPLPHQGFLRRSKSTWDARKLANSYQLPNIELELPIQPFSYAASQKDLFSLQREPSRRTGAVYGNSVTIGSGFMKARRKSISSTRESKMALGLPESWSPPPPAPTLEPAERKRRTSAFFGLASSTPEPASKSPPPPPAASGWVSPLVPPMHAFTFPPRASSRFGYATPPLPSEKLESGDGEALVMIGVALGTPTKETSMLESTEPLAMLETTKSHPIPSEPLNRLHSTSPPRPPKTAGRSSVGKERLEGPPKTAGWKRMFGRGLFGNTRKRAAKSRDPTPEVPELPKPATLKKTKRSGSSATKTPCLDVIIPSVEMERYSVMFGSLLQPSEKSSLFARRQSRDVVLGIPNLKTEDSNQDALAKLTSNSKRPEFLSEIPHPRLITFKRTLPSGGLLTPRSPLVRLGDDLRNLSNDSISTTALTPTRTHSFNGLPSPSFNSLPSPASPGLKRSNSTASDGRPSPIPTQPTYSNHLSHMRTQDEQTFYFCPSPSSRSLIRTPSRISKISEESNTLDTPPRSSFDDGDDSLWMKAHQSDEDEPQWEMLTPPPVSSSSEVDLVTAVEISIARQISLSRGQLLLPIVPKSQMLVSRKTVKDSIRDLKPRLVEHRRASSVSAKSAVEA